MRARPLPRRARDAGHAWPRIATPRRRRPLRSFVAARAPAEAEQDPLTADLQGSDVDLASQLRDARVAGSSSSAVPLGPPSARSGAYAASSSHAAHAPTPATTTPASSATTTVSSSPVLADARELMVEGDERVVASQAASFLVRSHAPDRVAPPRRWPRIEGKLSEEQAPRGSTRPKMHELSTFAHRRAAFFDAMAAASPSAVAVVPAAPVFVRNNDVEHEYRQDSDFFYLTGLDEPESVAIFDASARTMVLLVRPRDPEREIWDGPRTGVDGAKSVYGASEAFVVSELDEKLSTALQNHRRLYYRLGKNRPFDDRVLAIIDRLRTASGPERRRPARSSTRATSSTRCASGSRRARSRRCAPRWRSRARRTSWRWRKRAPGCASTRSRPSCSTRSAATGRSGRPTGASSAPAPTRASSTTARTTASSPRATSCSSTPGASTGTTRPTSRARSRSAATSPVSSRRSTSSCSRRSSKELPRRGRASPSTTSTSSRSTW